MAYKHKSRGKRYRARLRPLGFVPPAIVIGFMSPAATAGQLAASAFQSYSGTNYATIQPSPFALYTVSVGGLRPTQLNEGLTEVGKKAAGFDLLAPSALQANLLTDIEPVVIGPGGVLYLTDGHHTFTALQDSIYGASNPTVFVNVVANYSNLTAAQFFQTMQSQNLLLPLNDGVPQTVDTATGAPIPTTLTGLTSDPYRGLEYSILKNKSSKLFTTTANITGAVGAATPGLDKMTGFYSDFLEAAAYRNANNGRGLPYLSTGDIALATQWNLNGASTTTLPNVVGTVTAAQLPGFILANSITLAGPITNATLANGALDGNGTFTGITTINAGTSTAPINIGTPNTGFIMQLGSDKSNTVTLSGTNSYTGGTSILAGDLIIGSDASLGAAVPGGATLDPNNVRASVQAANGIVFNSLSEGNGTLTIGTAAGNGTGTFTTARPIAVSGEAATINLNGYITTLTGQLMSFGSNGVGLGNATGVSDLTIDDTAGNKGVLVLSTASPYFYGNLIIGNTNAPTVRVMNDAALGNTTGVAASIGQIDLNSGTLQAGASFSAAERNIFLGSGSNFDVNGFSTTWGTLTDVQRTLKILNSNTTTAGAATFNTLAIGGTATVQLAGGTAGETVTLTNGVSRAPGATLVLQPTSSSSLGTTTEKLFSGNGTASLVNTADPIAPVFMVTNNGAGSSAGPYDFVTYGANGYVKATYNNTGTFNSSTDVLALGANATPGGNVAAFALNTEGHTISLGSNTLTLGDGTNAAGLILGSNSSIVGGTLAFGGSEGVIWLSGSNPTITSSITGSNGLTFAGSGTVALSTAASLSGAVTIDSGTVTLSGTDIFAGDATEVTLADTKSKPAAATLNVTASNTLTSLNSAGKNSFVTIGNGAKLTIGDTAHNLSSTFSSKITETGGATAGALTFNGSGLMDLSGGAISLVNGSTIVVDNSAQLRLAVGALSSSNFGITLNGTSDLQFAQNGGGMLANTITGTGTLHLIGGTLQVTGTANTYSGGTIVETGSVLDITTANLPAANPNITNAGGLVLFDQATTGTYSGVISDGRQLGVGAVLSGSFDKDDSTGANTGNVTLANAQTYTGATTVEAGTLTLGAVDTIATSSGVDLGRVGGGATATLVLGANNTVKALTSEASNTTAINLGANTLTINLASATPATFGGVISGTGAVVKTGAGTEVFSGTNLYTGATSINGGTLQGGAANAFSAASATTTGSGGTLDLGGFAQTINAVSLSGGTLQNGSLTGAVTSTGGTINTLAGSATLALSGGTTNAVGVNTYTGATTINGGTFNVVGSVTASNLIVNAGGTLAGTGKIGDPQINAGGTLAPGNPANPYGTLTIVGPLGFAAGSFYNVSITAAGQNSRTDVVGATTIGGGTVNVAAGRGTYALSTKYTILNATSGVRGSFAGVQTNLAFLTPTLTYDATNVFLTITTSQPIVGANGTIVPDYRTAAQTRNQHAVAAGLVRGGIANGATGAVLTAFNQLTASQARGAFDAISGEGLIAAQNVAHRSSALFTSAIFDQTTFFGGGSGSAVNSVVLTEPTPGFLAYAPDGQMPVHELADLANPSRQPTVALAPQHSWRAWGTGFGETETIHGSDTAGSATQQDTIYGGVVGVDYQLMSNYRLGVAVGGSDGNFQVPGRTTSGDTTGGHVAFYDIATFGAFYGASSTSFSYYTNRTTRMTGGFGGLTSETERGNFDSHEFRSRVEFGRVFDGLNLGATGSTLTPFVALELADLRSNGFSETAVTGPGLLGLNVSGQSSASVPAFVGLRLQQSMALGGGMIFSPTLEVAYLHDFAPQRIQNATLASLPGSTFLVDGANPGTNAAQVKLGGELSLGARTALFANFDGQVSGVSQAYAGKGGFRYVW